MSDSSCVRIGSFLRVAETIGPTSSRSGKNTSIFSTPFSCAIATTRWVSSSLASSSTSPVPGSTMSAAANAPVSASSVIAMSFTPALRRPSMWDFVIFLPSPIDTSPALTSLRARWPTSPSPTAQYSALSRRLRRSTWWKVRMISSAPRSPRARRNTVARNLRLRSMRTYSRFLVSYSNSTQDPRYGMICATYRFLSSEWKKAPGERCSCETMTRSVPLMMKVPLSVISGMSPK